MALRDGELLFDQTGDVVGPGLVGEEFMQLQFVKDSGYRSGTYTGDVRLGRQQVHGRPFFASFHFARSRLCRVELCMDVDTPPDREEWAKKTELERKRAHEQWCEEHLGEPLRVVGSGAPGSEQELMRERTYPWGNIRSIYDGRGGFSFVRLEYAPAPTPTRGSGSTP